jgi:hypothetical protein
MTISLLRVYYYFVDLRQQPKSRPESEIFPRAFSASPSRSQIKSADCVDNFSVIICHAAAASVRCRFQVELFSDFQSGSASQTLGEVKPLLVLIVNAHR